MSVKTEKEHYKRTEQFVKEIQNLYFEVAEYCANISKNYSLVEGIFTFKDHPVLNRKVDRIIDNMRKSMYATIVSGISKEWDKANENNDELVKRLLKKTNIPLKKYQTRNLDALEAFQERKIKGLKLSDRVWNYTNQFKGEIEQALDVGIADGRSAAQLSRDIREYLREPEKLFRRVRDKNGVLKASKNALRYNPGGGVYRSSYKNAMRLTRTEINMAYRTADHLRWQQLDFVVGIEIRRSNHYYACDVCESLKGKYPKDFKFIGWHPHCRCHAIPIMATEKELLDSIDNDSPIQSKNEVRDMPNNFTKWVKDNQARIDGSRSKPLWMIENRNFIDNQSQPLVSFVKAKSAKEAEEWVTKNIPFIKSADYSGISRNDANRLNEHLTYLQNKGFMKGCDGTIKLVPFRGKVSDPVGGGYQMLKHGQKDARLRIDVWSDKKFKALEKKAEKQVEKQLKKVIANWEAALATIENDLAAYYKDPAMEKMTWGDDRLDVLLKRKKAIKDLMEKDIASFKANRANKMKRAMDFVSNVSENMEDNLTHEMGHALNANLQTNSHAYSSEVRSLLKRMKKKYDYYPDREGIIFETNSNLFDRSMLEHGIKVSEYACTNGAEYFAESFTMFMKGKELPDKELEKLFKLIVRL